MYKSLMLTINAAFYSPKERFILNTITVLYKVYGYQAYIQ